MKQCYLTAKFWFLSTWDKKLVCLVLRAKKQQLLVNSLFGVGGNQATLHQFSCHKSIPLRKQPDWCHGTFFFHFWSCYLGYSVEIQGWITQSVSKPVRLPPRQVLTFHKWHLDGGEPSGRGQGWVTSLTQWCHAEVTPSRWRCHISEVAAVFEESVES